MTAPLNWRVWVAAALAAGLAFTHLTAYRSGMVNVRAEWTAEKLKQTGQLAAFDAENRRIEQRRNSIIMEAQHAAKQREILAAAAARGLRTELDGLRDDLASARTRLSSASISSLHQRITALDTVFEQCARRVEGLAGDAQGIASDARLILDAWPK
ncbi:MAG: hypothetical protein ACRC7C_19875 [Beijerinckiaceae bacterium]